MKRILLVLTLAILLTSVASADTFRITNVGSALPFSGGMTNVHYSSGSTVIGAYKDRTNAYVGYSDSSVSVQTAWHNPHTVQHYGTGNQAYRTLEPTGWNMRSSTVRSSDYGIHLTRSPSHGTYYATGRVGTPQSSIYPTSYRQPPRVQNYWGMQSNHYSYPSTYSATTARATNYW